MATLYTVTFVCMGNICRSPTAHGVFRHRLRACGLAKTVRVESAGTHGLHRGSPPDVRAQKHAAQRGYDLSDLRSRPLLARDIERSDLLLAMDDDNVASIEERCDLVHRHKLRRLTDFCRRHAGKTAVPDPYYGGPAGFEQVLDIVEDACDGLLEHVQRALAERAQRS